jgi:hypothetical protein
MKRFNARSIAGKAVLNTLLTSPLLLVLSAFTLTTTASAAELVVNGGFEEPVNPVGASGFSWWTYNGQNFSGTPNCPPPAPTCSDKFLVPGWAVFWTDDIINFEQLTPGRLEIQSGSADNANPPIPPGYNGSLQKAELDSHHRLNDDGTRHANNNVTITQHLPTCPLTAYTLNYAWKSRTEEPNDNDVRVVINRDEVLMHAQNKVWEEETYHFISDDSNETLLLFGSIGTASTTGMFLDEVSVTGPDGSDPYNCSLVCDDKPFELTLRYNGNDDSNNHQSGREVIISPEDVIGTFPADATILVYGHKWKNRLLLGEFDVSIGGFFSVRGPRNRIPPRLTFEIYDNGAEGDPVQTVTFHTSCSQPMDAGDEFGAITVWSAIN